MAARNPTSFTAWIDETLLESGEPILAATPDQVLNDATPDQVLNDQVFLLDMEHLVSTCSAFYYVETAAAFTEQFRFYVKNKDKCDVDHVTNNEIACEVYAYVWCSDGTTAGEFRFDSNGAVANTTATGVIPAGTTSATWIQAADDLAPVMSGSRVFVL
jgi:hypothetical protein